MKLTIRDWLWLTVVVALGIACLVTMRQCAVMETANHVLRVRVARLEVALRDEGIAIPTESD